MSFWKFSSVDVSLKSQSINRIWILTSAWIPCLRDLIEFFHRNHSTSSCHFQPWGKSQGLAKKSDTLDDEKIFPVSHENSLLPLFHQSMSRRVKICCGCRTLFHSLISRYIVCMISILTAMADVIFQVWKYSMMCAMWHEVIMLRW